MMDNTRSKRFEWSGWTGVLLAAFTGLVAITVQWGVVNTKLEGLERRLDDMIFESRSLRQEYSNMERRLARLEGLQLSKLKELDVTAR